jgi:DNA-binding CsgD family transcriptional regulator
VALRLQAAVTPDDDAPGMVVLDGRGDVESVTPQAQRWLAALAAPGDGGPPLPDAVHAVAIRARRAREGVDAGVPRARVRAADGRWLVVHGAPLHGGGEDRVAVMIEPARRADLAPLIVELYGLTERERQVTELLARGLATEEIAQALWLSRHTVRDYTKAVYAKFGVSSRPELTATLFAEHHLPALREQGG